jgi:hypothetical protein
LEKRPFKNRSLSEKTLVGFIILFACSGGWSLLQENGLISDTVYLLDAETSASLATALFGVNITLQTFRFGLMPYLVYRVRPAEISQMFLKGKGPFIRIAVQNTGTGIAIFHGLSFHEKGGQPIQKQDLIHARLQARGMKKGVDYRISRLSDGTALAPQENLILMEIRQVKLKEWRNTTIYLDYRSALGTPYRKVVVISDRL